MTRRVVFTVALLALLARGPAAFACSCVAAPTVSHYKQANVVFVGTAMTVRSAEGSFVAVDFSVADLYKGSAADHLTVYTPASVGACGIAFLPGQRYTVFARGAPAPSPQTSLCDGTTDDTHALATAGYVRPSQRFDSAGAIPQAAHRNGGRTAAIAIAAVLLLAAGGTIWAGRRRGATRGEG